MSFNNSMLLPFAINVTKIAHDIKLKDIEKAKSNIIVQTQKEEYSKFNKQLSYTSAIVKILSTSCCEFMCD